MSIYELKKFSGQLSEKLNSIKADGFQKKQGCRIKADHELEDKKRILPVVDHRIQIFLIDSVGTDDQILMKYNTVENRIHFLD